MEKAPTKCWMNLNRLAGARRFSGFVLCHAVISGYLLLRYDYLAISVNMGLYLFILL